MAGQLVCLVRGDPVLIPVAERIFGHILGKRQVFIGMRRCVAYQNRITPH